MPNRLHRYYGAGYLHFITTNCYRRWPLLGPARSVMPEHVPLLISKPQRGDPSAVMEALKQGFRHYAYDEPGPSGVAEAQRAELRVRKIS